MAKNNNNYISSMIAQYGEFWIQSISVENIQRSVKRLIKDMIRGSINYEQVGNYFLDFKFLENIIIAVKNELESNTLIYNALVFYREYYPQVPNINAQISHIQILCHIYQTILERLEIVKTTGNIGYLSDISGLLYNYRAHLN